MTDTSYVKSETHNGITTIEFFHPQGNSMPALLLEKLSHHIHSAGNEEETKVILLRSAGNTAFCAGASISELTSIASLSQATDFFTGFAHVINAIRKVTKIVVARIHGRCIGGGVGIAAAADYAIALEGADIKLSELSLGIGPFVVGPVIERKIGFSAFSNLAIDSSMWRNAEWAKRKGLYAELHSSIENMDESISRLCNSLSHSSPHAMAELKKTLWKGTENWDQYLSERAAISGRLLLEPAAKKALEGMKK
jgi:methylglutaconyl-CoA hydratase